MRDIGLAPAPDRITVERLECERDGVVGQVAVGPEDIVLLTTGSQAAGLSAGSMTEPPPKRRGNSTWALWQRMAKDRPGFGDPDVFFGDAVVPDARWITFTVTTTGDEFIDQITALTGSEPGRGGLVTLKDSGWVLSLSIFHQPEIIGQPEGTKVWWGYGLHPERTGDFVRKRMDECTGAEILEEVLRQLRFDRQFDATMASSICVPCDMPYVNNIWMPRRRSDRPPPGPGGVHQSRPDRPVCRSRAGRGVHHRVFGPHGLGGDPHIAAARPRTATRLPGLSTIRRRCSAR